MLSHVACSQSTISQRTLFFSGLENGNKKFCNILLFGSYFLLFLCRKYLTKTRLDGYTNFKQCVVNICVLV